MDWDPHRYLRFADHRARPGLDLMARIPDHDPATIVDLGAGTGNLTAVLAARWPRSSILAIDASEEMLGVSTDDDPNVRFQLADIGDWEPDAPIDLIFSNAALHWLDDHDSLFPRLRSYLSPRGVLAVQMPDNWAAPTHRIPVEILDSGTWPRRAVEALRRQPLASPDQYLRWVQPATVDMWRTTYHQTLVGDHPVWSWVTGSILRPVLDVLEGDELVRFTAECREQYLVAYPPRTDGSTPFEFSRLFFVAQAG